MSKMLYDISPLLRKLSVVETFFATANQQKAKTLEEAKPNQTRALGVIGGEGLSRAKKHALAKNFPEDEGFQRFGYIINLPQSVLENNVQG